MLEQLPSWCKKFSMCRIAGLSDGVEAWGHGGPVEDRVRARGLGGRERDLLNVASLHDASLGILNGGWKLLTHAFWCWRRRLCVRRRKERRLYGVGSTASA